MRVQNRDCWSALLRLAVAMKTAGIPVSVNLPCSGPQWLKVLRDLAHRWGVELHDWRQIKATPKGRKILDLEFPDSAAYGGGVRPCQTTFPNTGHDTLPWWGPNCGLGPSAVPRKQFVDILEAVRAGIGLALVAAEDAKKAEEATL